MPAALPRAPRYCRQKETNRPDRAYCKIAGKRILLGNYGSPESYKRYAELINGERKAPAAPAPEAPTMSMLLVKYLDYAAGKYVGDRANEVKHIKQVFKLLRATHGKMYAKDFGPRAYKELRLAMIELDWSRTYIRDQCGRVKRFVGWAVSEELLPQHARHALDSVPSLSAGEFGVRETPAVEPVPDAVVEATLRHLRPVVADMVRIQRLTGMRPGEVCQLAGDHIDRTDEVWIFTPLKHKTQKRGKKRTIALGPKSQAILSKYLFGERCFPILTDSYRRAVSRACQRGGVEKWHPHQLRHSAATAIRDAFGIEHAQTVLGHARADMTQHYARANQDKAIEVALRIG